MCNAVEEGYFVVMMFYVKFYLCCFLVLIKPQLSILMVQTYSAEDVLGR